jgi:hypothetical protein
MGEPRIEIKIRRLVTGKGTQLVVAVGSIEGCDDLPMGFREAAGMVEGIDQWVLTVGEMEVQRAEAWTGRRVGSGVGFIGT